jgi:rare lipoprotein A
MSHLERTLLRRAPWLIAALLAACASGPRFEADGPGANPPPDLLALPDATPRVEPLRRGGPNKPYAVLGQSYVPMTEDLPLHERGLASWYGRKFHGRPTSNGETYDMYAMTAAHKTMPLPSYARVRNPANGREVIVRVNDRGPFHPDRVIDLSYVAALKLDLLRGVAPVEVDRLTGDEIRAGSWDAPGGPLAAAAAPPGAAPDMPPDAPLDAPMVAATGFWLQLGAFRDRDGALQLQRLVQGQAPWLAQVETFDDGTWARVQAGPYVSRSDAEAAAARLADALPLRAMVLRRP